MKKIYKYIPFLFLCLTTLVGCSKDNSPKSEESVQTVPAKVDLDMDVDQEELARLVQTVSSATGQPAAVPFLSGKDLKVQVAFRRKNDYNAVTYHTLTFKKDRDYDIFHYRSSNLTMPSGSGQIEAAAIILEEVGGTVFTTYESASRVKSIATSTLAVANGGKVETKIPYVADWTTLADEYSGGSWYQYKLKLKFHPSGTLLRMKIRNKKDGTRTNMPHTATVDRVVVETNAFVSEWRYDFTRLTGNNLVEGEDILGNTTSVEGRRFTFELPQRITLQPTEESQGYYYLWVMPTTNTSVETLAFTWGDSYPVRAYYSENRLAVTDASPVGYKRSVSRPINLDVRYPIPLEYMAKYNIRPGGGDYFATSQANNQSGYLSQAEARNIHIPHAFYPLEYFLPKQEDWASILPTISDHLWSFSGTVTENDIRLPWESSARSFTAEYYSPSSEMSAYAIRFIQGGGSDRHLAVAYRYELVGSWADNTLDSHLKITSCYVGDNYTLAQVSTPSFWSDPDRRKTIVTRRLPVGGFKTTSNPATLSTIPAQHLGSAAYYWTSESQTPGTYKNFIFFNPLKVNIHRNDDLNQYFLTRMFSMIPLG